MNQHYSIQYQDFLRFEEEVFKEMHPISLYDPHLIRYGEYQFVLDHLQLQASDVVLDLGCGFNIFPLYVASKGAKTIAIDYDRSVWKEMRKRLSIVEKEIGHRLPFTFAVGDATDLQLDTESVDKAVAVSSIKHMFCDRGHGDQLAVNSIARVLKPGGLAIITVPMSQGNPFHERPNGDELHGGPYRLYTPEAIEERMMSNPTLKLVNLQYLAHTTPDPRYTFEAFAKYWTGTLSQKERMKWAWANPMLAQVFNPMLSKAEGEANLAPVNTALICLRKEFS
ncbi:class I SAM-dependent methyltransferase [Chloroflexi bacterium TSY]|nr:class I SAM-dependent methyltransferase [Chloroflexi bacterium TSY]